MIALTDGRKELYQWDTNVSVTVPKDCTQVHFSNSVYGRSFDVNVIGGVAIIPDVLLQTDKDLNAWAFVGKAENGYTKISKVFNVNKRNKPADYVFTPVEQVTIAEIAAIAQSVRDDADAGMFDGEVPDALPNPHKLIFTGAVTAEYDGSEDVTVDVPASGGGTENALTTTYGEEIALLTETVEIPTDTPVTVLEFDLPEIAKELNHFVIHLNIGKPTNEHTAARTMLNMFNGDLVYWNIGNSPTNGMYELMMIVDYVRRIVWKNGPSINSIQYNFVTTPTTWRWLPVLTSTHRNNNKIKLTIFNEYAGTIVLDVLGYR